MIIVYLCRMSMLIVLEGLDGAGKSTQVRKLKKYLEERTGKLEYVHFPRYDAPVYGGLISRFLKGDFGSNDAVHPQLVALLFAEDSHGAAPHIREVLEGGGNVLLDRYVYSNIAYQCAKLEDEEEREALRQWIFDTEYGAFGLPVPDLNIFLDVPVGIPQFGFQNHLEIRFEVQLVYVQIHADEHEVVVPDDLDRTHRDLPVHDRGLGKCSRGEERKRRNER